MVKERGRVMKLTEFDAAACASGLRGRIRWCAIARSRSGHFLAYVTYLIAITSGIPGALYAPR